VISRPLGTNAEGPHFSARSGGVPLTHGRQAPHVQDLRKLEGPSGRVSELQPFNRGFDTCRDLLRISTISVPPER